MQLVNETPRLDARVLVHEPARRVQDGVEDSDRRLRCRWEPEPHRSARPPSRDNRIGRRCGGSRQTGRRGAGWSTRCWPRSCAGSPGGTDRHGCGGSPRSGSPCPAAAQVPGSLPPRRDGPAGVGSSSGAGPGPDASAAAFRAGRTTRARSGAAADVRVQPAPLGRPSRAVAGPPGAAAPRLRGAVSAARRPWRPSFVSATRATAVPGRTADTAVVGSCADHRGPIASSTNPQLSTHDRLSGTHTPGSVSRPPSPASTPPTRRRCSGSLWPRWATARRPRTSPAASS